MFQFILQPFELISSQSYCYQESATISNQKGTDGSCDLFYNGSYLYIGANWNYPEVFYNGLWSGAPTCSGGSGSGQHIYINYTKPLNSISAISLNKISDLPLQNTSIPSTCFNFNSKTLMLRASASFDNPTMFAGLYCYNGTNWETLVYKTGNRNLYEEGIFWVFESYSEKPLTSLSSLTGTSQNIISEEPRLIYANYGNYTLTEDLSILEVIVEKIEDVVDVVINTTQETISKVVN